MRLRLTAMRIWTVGMVLLLSGCQPADRENSFKYVSLAQETAMHHHLREKGGRAGLISAHRGGPMPGFPENALATFENSLTYAPCLIECDVRETADGVLVLMHDAELERTSNGSGRVGNRNFAYLRRLRLRDPSGALTPYPIPSLGEALEWGRGRCIFTLDVKVNSLFPAVIAAIERHNAYGFALVITYTHGQALQVHELNPRVVISVSAGSIVSLQRLIQAGIPSRRLVAFVGVREPSAAVYALLRRNGIPSILGTMNNLDRRARLRGDDVYRDLYRNGADILSTDHVRRVARALMDLKRTDSSDAEEKN